MSLKRLLDYWRQESSINPNIMAWDEITARPGRLVQFPNNLNPVIQCILEQRGITHLYSHQARAWELSQLGQNFIIVTGTASGKTLCYNLPVINHLLENPSARALFLFPTKALAQDQQKSLNSLLAPINNYFTTNSLLLSSAIYDGDTPQNQRAQIRTKARIILSNPDMLHTGILPHHTLWNDFFKYLKFIVIDEVHIYRGVFGSHVANVIRRLKRIANFYGSHPEFILTSATIANPSSFANKLIGDDVVTIDDDGSIRGSQNFLIYNPPVINKEIGLRKSPFQESIRLAEDLLSNNVQTLIFSQSRPSVEILLSYLRNRMHPSPGVTADQIRGYRSGYLPWQRRDIEKGLREGTLRAVVATNALELGIDIGGIEAVIIVGFPGSIAATRQQAGRSGRGELPSLAIMVTTADPIDQFLASHPDFLMSHSVESALIDPDNLLILMNHLRCAAFELPFKPDESFGNVNPATLMELMQFLVAKGDLHQSGDKFFWMADQYPSQQLSLRSSSTNSIILQVMPEQEETHPRVIGQVDYESALWMVHPEAIYLHEAEAFFVQNLDLEKRMALLNSTSVDYYTQPRRETKVEILKKTLEQDDQKVVRGYGEIKVITQVIGYKKVNWSTHEILGYGDLQLPPVELETCGYWIVLKETLTDNLREAGLWRNDQIDYGPNWSQQRSLTRQRDGYRCQICGLLEDGREHDVHHKTPFRTFSSYLQANYLANLITLCHTCHQKAEVNVRVKSGLSGLAFVLGNIAPLFLMCDAHDLGVNTEPQSPLFSELPTIIIYEGIPAGIGFSQHLFSIHSDFMKNAYDLVFHCGCLDGCPSCVGPGGENGLGGKEETLKLLEALLANEQPIG
jgi:DEAD/DEAH box helicase domain-containing protein